MLLHDATLILEWISNYVLGVAQAPFYIHSVLGIPIPKSLAFWASPVGDAQNADRFDYA